MKKTLSAFQRKNNVSSQKDKKRVNKAGYTISKRRIRRIMKKNDLYQLNNSAIQNSSKQEVNQDKSI